MVRKRIEGQEQSQMCAGLIVNLTNHDKQNKGLHGYGRKIKKSQIEDDQHILSVCVMNNELTQERHNRLVNKIGKELKNNFPERKVQIERTWRRGTELVKPDISCR